MPAPGPTRELASFVGDLRFDDLDDSVVHYCKILVLDQFGAELVGSTMPWAKKVYNYVKGLGGTAKCTVVNYGLRTSPEAAAFVNGTFGHSFDVDDFNGYGRPGSAIIPAVLAAAEQRRISGREFVTATVAGYEVWVRVMNSISPSSLLERGFHTVSVNGVMGATAGVGKAMSLGSDEIASAFGIAGSHASGLAEFTKSGSDVMRIHAGIAAMGGLRSVVLASLGFSGPQNILEGEKGYVQAFANAYDLGSLTRGLGREWLILKTGIKPYACAASIHPAILSIEELYSTQRFDPNEIGNVIVGTNSLALKHGGGKIGPKPKDFTGMQYSLEFGVALALILRDNLLRGYAEKNLRNERLLSMAKKVSLVLDQEIEDEFQSTGRIAGRVTLVMKDGRRLGARSLAKGQSYYPMSDDEITAKFIALARTVLSESQTERLMSETKRLDDMSDISKLFRFLLSHVGKG